MRDTKGEEMWSVMGERRGKGNKGQEKKRKGKAGDKKLSLLMGGYTRGEK